MAMFTQHLIEGEDFYIDPLNGSNQVIECKLLQKNPNIDQSYIFKSVHDGKIYIVNQSNVYKKKHYALKGQQVRRIKAGGGYRKDTVENVLQSIMDLSHKAGEPGYLIRDLLQNIRITQQPPQN